MDSLTNELPLVTILSPCYNHSKYVIESLESIKAQTYPNIEHIIIDDFSTDNSVEIINNWIQKNNYKCLFIKHDKNYGISYTLNESIDLAKGKYWSPIATDDFMVSQRTSKFVNYLEKEHEVNMVVSDMGLIDENSIVIKMEGYESMTRFYNQKNKNFNLSLNYGTHESLILGNYIASSVMLKKEVFQKVGKYRIGLKMEDWNMWLRISKLGRIHYIDEQLSMYRYHGTNANSNLEIMLEDHYKTIIKFKSSFKKYKKEKEFNDLIRKGVIYYLNRRKYIKVLSFLIKGNPLVVSGLIFQRFKNKYSHIL